MRRVSDPGAVRISLRPGVRGSIWPHGSTGDAMEIELPGPEEPKPPYGRTAHPYYLHDMIRSQPSAIAKTVSAIRSEARSIPPPPPDRTLLFTGMGTSFHAARASAWAAASAFEYELPIRAVDAFDLLLEPDLLRRAGTAIIFSSSGETALTLRAQSALRAARVPVILITGTPTSRSGALADHRLLTQEANDAAWVHTVSYTTAIAAALTLLDEWTGAPSVEPTAIEGAVRSVVEREEDWKHLAVRLDPRPQVLCLGSGPAETTAREAALKLREGAARYVVAAGVEEFLHGILPSIDASVAALAVATSDLDRRRAVTSLAAAARAGAESVLFARGLPNGESPNEFELPKVEAALTPIVDIVPFQFLTYWLAVGRGRNPDVMGFDDPRILAARSGYGI